MTTLRNFLFSALFAALLSSCSLFSDRSELGDAEQPIIIHFENTAMTLLEAHHRYCNEWSPATRELLLIAIRTQAPWWQSICRAEGMPASGH